MTPQTFTLLVSRHPFFCRTELVLSAIPNVSFGRTHRQHKRQPTRNHLNENSLLPVLYCGHVLFTSSNIDEKANLVEKSGGRLERRGHPRYAYHINSLAISVKNTFN